jgi:periplasmic divalent cation tolerance protein
MAKYIQVLTTTGTKTSADKMAKPLIGKGLAACVQVLGPVSSTYGWKGKVEHGSEWLCMVKTTGSKYKAVERAIRANHSYEIPEIISLPI